jgi:Transposase DDE domain
MSRQSARVQYTPEQVWPIFERLLPHQVVAHLLAQVTQRFYQRLFPPLVVLWGFIYQRLQADHTCDAFVGYLTSGAAPHLYRPLAGRRPMSENTAAYCQARNRLPLSVAQGSLRHSAHAISATMGARSLWCGRRVALLDGTTVRLTAEAALVSHYGLPRGQHGASHWPRLRTVGAFDLHTGTLCEVVEGPYATTEQTLAIQLLRNSQAAMLWVGDQLFGIYHLLQVVVACHQDAVFRIQARHIRRWTTSKLASGSDLDVVWPASPADQLEADLPAGAIAGRLLYVRVEHPGFRPIDVYLFTTLTDRQLYPAEAIVQLYARRWHVELNLRHVKTTMAMELLTGKSVDIIRKEWTLGLLAYNLIRGLMGQAALRAGLSPLCLSFARCWRRIVATAHRLPSTQSAIAYEQVAQALLDRLATCRLPVRTQLRFEPRNIWPKPHQYPYLLDSRAAARQRSLEKLWNKS